MGLFFSFWSIKQMDRQKNKKKNSFNLNDKILTSAWRNIFNISGRITGANWGIWVSDTSCVISVIENKGKRLFFEEKKYTSEQHKIS